MKQDDLLDLLTGLAPALPQTPGTYRWLGFHHTDCLDILQHLSQDIAQDLGLYVDVRSGLFGFGICENKILSSTGMSMVHTDMFANDKYVSTKVVHFRFNRFDHFISRGVLVPSMQASVISVDYAQIWRRTFPTLS